MTDTTRDDTATTDTTVFETDDEGYELCPVYGARILPGDDGECSLCGAPDEHGITATNADPNSPTRVHPADPWILMVRRVTGAGGKLSRPAAWIVTDGDTDDYVMGPDRAGQFRASFPTRLDAWHAAEYRAASERGYMGVVVQVVDGPLW